MDRSHGVVPEVGSLLVGQRGPRFPSGVQTIRINDHSWAESPKNIIFPSESNNRARCNEPWSCIVRAYMSGVGIWFATRFE